MSEHGGIFATVTQVADAIMYKLKIPFCDNTPKHPGTFRTNGQFALQ